MSKHLLSFYWTTAIYFIKLYKNQSNCCSPSTSNMHDNLEMFEWQFYCIWKQSWSRNFLSPDNRRLWVKVHIWDSRLYPIKFFKGCLPQILLGPFWNTLFQMQFQFTLQLSIPIKFSWYLKRQIRFTNIVKFKSNNHSCFSLSLNRHL